MKILVVTPIYDIVGREDLIHDSSAIHYLISPLSSEHDIFVLDTYLASIKEIKRFVNKTSRNYYRNGYEYDDEGIHVNLIETQLLPKQVKLRIIQRKRLKKAISKTIEKIIPDIIVVHFPTTYIGIMDTISIRVPIMGILHQTDIRNIGYDKNLQAVYLNRTYNSILPRSKRIYEVAKDLRVDVKETIVFSGIDTNSNFVRNTEGKTLRVLYVGKLVKRKNVDVLIRGYCDFKKSNPYFSTSLCIVGDGPERGVLEKLSRDDDSIFFTGNKKREEVLNYMESSDVFIMPSVKETLGLVYLEAMSKGCITVGTINEGIDGIIEDSYNGFLINPYELEVKKVLEKVVNLDAENRKKMSMNAVRTAEKYSVKSAAENYYDRIMDCINGAN